MYKTIILAYDGSATGQQALLQSQQLAQWSHAKLWLVAVMPAISGFPSIDGGLYSPELAAEQTQRYERVLTGGLQHLSGGGFEARGEVLVGETVHELSAFARKVDADLIVVGHKHLDSWAARWWAGSISGALIEHAPCSVLCVITR